MIIARRYGGDEATAMRVIVMTNFAADPVLQHRVTRAPHERVEGRGVETGVGQRRREAPAVIPPDPARQDPYAAWQAAGRLTPRLRDTLARAAQKLGANGPKISVLVDTRGCTPDQLAALSASLSAQLYPAWEAWFVGAPAPYAAESRCRAEKCSGPKDVVRALNAAAHQSGGTLLTLLPGLSELLSLLALLTRLPLRSIRAALCRSAFLLLLLLQLLGELLCELLRALGQPCWTSPCGERAGWQGLGGGGNRDGPCRWVLSTERTEAVVAGGAG